MPRTLDDEDIQALALRIVEIMGKRLTTPEPPREPPAPAPPAPPPEKKIELKSKLTYTLAELSTELSVSKVTIYRLVYRGLLKPLPYVRIKTFTRKEVERFLEEGTTWAEGRKRLR